jgi:MFS family permease
MQKRDREALPKPALFIWLGIAAILTYSSWSGISTRSGWDPDDQLRLVQLRDFLGGQSWFDTTQYRLYAPEGGPMHWSRLIEIPLALIVLMATPLVGPAVAEMIAGTLIPLLCYGLVAYMLGRIALRLGGPMAGTVAVVMTMVSPAISMQLRPMRIDHHGWQLVCAALALWTLFWPTTRKAGISMGLALAVWLHISLEGAPVTAAFFGLLGWRWAMSREDGTRLGYTVGTFLIASLALFFGSQLGGLAAPNFCDTISPAHIFAIVAAGAIIVPASFAMPAKKWLRLAALVAAGTAALTILLWQAPMCAKGAFSTMDPVVRDYWYVRVNEGMPVWHQKWTIALSLLGVPIAGAVSLLFLGRSIETDRKADFVGLAVLLVYAALLALLVFRTISVATLIAVPLLSVGIAALFGRYRTEPIATRRIGLVALMIVMLMPGAFISQAASLFSKKAAAEMSSGKLSGSLAAKQCESAESVSTLAGLKKANIVAPFDIGPLILLSTPHSVMASSHHRNEKGMRAHIDIYRLPPAQSLAIVERRKVTHIVGCSDEAEMQSYEKRNPKGLWAQLAKGNTPDWLEKMPDMGEGLKVWRVR